MASTKADQERHLVPIVRPLKTNEVDLEVNLRETTVKTPVLRSVRAAENPCSCPAADAAAMALKAVACFCTVFLL
jgi:hypothetical protein